MTKSSKIPRITLIITFLLNGSVSAARFGFQRTILSSLCYCTSTTLLLWVVTWASPRLYVDSATPPFGKPCLAMCTASSRHAPHVNRLNHLATNRLASFSLCQFLRGYGKIYHSISFPACRHHTTSPPFWWSWIVSPKVPTSEPFPPSIQRIGSPNCSSISSANFMASLGVWSPTGILSFLVLFGASFFVSPARSSVTALHTIPNPMAKRKS